MNKLINMIEDAFKRGYKTVYFDCREKEISLLQNFYIIDRHTWENTNGTKRTTWRARRRGK
jgi:hypothetical protein